MEFGAISSATNPRANLDQPGTSVANTAIRLPTSSLMARSNRLSIYLILSALLIVLGFKVRLINKFNPITPYWDQWDAEAARLYRPIIEGRFHVATLVSPHNEHRILFTRIINLAVLYAVGLWYPALQMVVNSFIHCAAIFVVVYLLTKCISLPVRGIPILFLTLLYVIPFDWQNTLSGFQSQFYLLIMFSTLAVHMTAKSKAFSGTWLLGLAFSVASYFNIASGALTAASSGAIMALQLAVGSRRNTARECLAVFICIGVSVIAVLGTPYSLEVATYKVRSLHEFGIAAINQASYPFGAPYGLLQYIPSSILVVRVLAKQPRLPAYEWSVLALLVWLGSQIAAISYGRGNQLSAVTASRYDDVLIIGLSVNLSVTFYLLRNFWSRYFAAHLGITALSVRWLLVLLVMAAPFEAWALPFGRASFAEATAFGDALERQTGTMEEFFRSGETMSSLQGKIIPYPDPQRLTTLASDPTIRSILHPALTSLPLRRGLLLPHWLSKLLRDLLLLLMQSGLILIGTGIGMWFAISSAILWTHRADRIARPSADNEP